MRALQKTLRSSLTCSKATKKSSKSERTLYSASIMRLSSSMAIERPQRSLICATRSRYLRSSAKIRLMLSMRTIYASLLLSMREPSQERSFGCSVISKNSGMSTIRSPLKISRGSIGMRCLWGASSWIQRCSWVSWSGRTAEWWPSMGSPQWKRHSITWSRWARSRELFRTGRASSTTLDWTLMLGTLTGKCTTFSRF